MIDAPFLVHGKALLFAGGEALVRGGSWLALRAACPGSLTWPTCGPWILP